MNMDFICGNLPARGSSMKVAGQEAGGTCHTAMRYGVGRVSSRVTEREASRTISRSGRMRTGAEPDGGKEDKEVER